MKPLEIKGRYLVQNRLSSFKIEDYEKHNEITRIKRDVVCESCLNDMGIRFTK